MFFCHFSADQVHECRYGLIADKKVSIGNRCNCAFLKTVQQRSDKVGIVGNCANNHDRQANDFEDDPVKHNKERIKLVDEASGEADFGSSSSHKVDMFPVRTMMVLKFIN